MNRAADVDIIRRCVALEAEFEAFEAAHERAYEVALGRTPPAGARAALNYRYEAVLNDAARVYILARRGLEADIRRARCDGSVSLYGAVNAHFRGAASASLPPPCDAPSALS